jgi:hypothetical protein
MSTSLNVEGFSISHAAILNGTTGAELAGGDMYGVRSGSLEVDMDEFDNTGDDYVLSTWQWFNYATVTIEMGYIPFAVIALLTGATITSSGAAPNNHFNLPIWEQGSLNQPTRPMLIRIPSKDSNGAVRTLDIVLYKCQFKPIGFDGPSYKDGLMLNYSAKALISDVDERGQALVGDRRAIGRLVGRPVV